MKSTLAWALTIALCFVSHIGMAQNSGLNPEQNQTFMKRKLSVEVVGRSQYSVNYSAGTGSGVRWRQWLAYEGFARISEPEFFRRAGYKREALAAEEYHAATRRTLWQAGCASVTGLLLSGIALAAGNSYDDAWEPAAVPWTIAGIVGICTATAGALCSMGGWKRMDTNWAPVSTVEGIADEYNHRLRDSLDAKE
jgi:hypothetical protein